MFLRRCSVLGSAALLLLSLAACGAPVVPPPDRTPLATSMPSGASATAAPVATLTPTPTRTPDSPFAAALGPLGLSGLANQFNTPQPLLAPPAAPPDTPVPTPPALAASPTAGAARSATETTPAASAPITATPTRPAAPTATTVPVPSPIPPAQPPTAAIAANIRSGPGLDYRIVGSVPAGAPLDVVATNADRTWFRLGDGNWIFAVLVTNPPRALQVINTPTP